MLEVARWQIQAITLTSPSDTAESRIWQKSESKFPECIDLLTF